MCVSDSAKDQWHTALEPLRLGPDPEYDRFYGSDDVSSPEGVAFPAVETKRSTLDASTIDEDLDITIATLGLENFEIGDKARRRSRLVHDWIKTEGRGQSYGFDPSLPEPSPSAER
jgi:hypothetical protein